MIVEDGTIVDNADSLCDLNFADAYHEARGNTAWADGDDDTKEPALIRATQYIMGKYRGRWSGQRTEGRDQVFDWPRVNCTDVNGDEIAEDEIPDELKQGISEAALRELAVPYSLTPDQDETQQIKRLRTKVGVLEKETEYVDNSGEESNRPTVTLIDEILAPLFTFSGSNRFAFLQRA